MKTEQLIYTTDGLTMHSHLRTRPIYGSCLRLMGYGSVFSRKTPFVM